MSRYLIAMIILNGSATACAEQRIMHKSVVVNAPIETVWAAWTTNEGLKFVSNQSNVELRVGGPYEWFLDLPADEWGYRGSEGSNVLAYLPAKMLAFSWTVPPDVPELRAKQAAYQVVVMFEDLGDGRIQVELHGLHWGTGPELDAVWDYFDQAWTYVLASLQERLNR